jgi:hypothetical protein
MSETNNKKTDKEKGDAVLRQMLKTPPKPKEKGGDKSRRPPILHQDRKDRSKTQ